MHELFFADALRPNPVCILNLPLAEYSLGHEIILFRRRNALLVDSQAEFSNLPFWKQIHAIREAVWICSATFSSNDRMEKTSVFNISLRWDNFKRKIWAARMKKLLPEDYALAVVDFRNYLAAAKPFPPSPSSHAVSVLYDKEAGESGRAFGQPLVLSLYQFILTLPETERPSCAWDYSFAKAIWLYFGKCEHDGAYRIENHKEWQVQAEKEQFEREVAAEKEEEAKSKAEKTTQNSEKKTDLATEPPVELKGAL